MNVKHPTTKVLKFTLGGTDSGGKYPAFNGQFRSLVYSIEKGAFVEDIAGLMQVMEDTKPFPSREVLSRES
jgi:hypothetical protein